MLELDPTEITFDLNEKEPTAVLKVHNPTKAEVAFKVKTTNPKRYLVRPNQDVVEVNGSMNVRISLQAKDAKAIVDALGQSGGDAGSVSKDKFMIQSAELRPEFKTMIEEARMDQSAGSKMISGVLSGLWQDAKKEELSNVKLKCKFITPDEAKSNEAEITGASINSGDFEDLTALRRKYNELVNFSVQLTSERDRLKNSCREASKELNSLRQQQGSSKDGLGRQAAAVTVESTGFSLWQIMLVAVVAFLIGRMLGN